MTWPADACKAAITRVIMLSMPCWTRKWTPCPYVWLQSNSSTEAGPGHGNLHGPRCSANQVPWLVRPALAAAQLVCPGLEMRFCVGLKGATLPRGTKDQAAAAAHRAERSPCLCHTYERTAQGPHRRGHGSIADAGPPLSHHHAMGTVHRRLVVAWAGRLCWETGMVRPPWHDLCNANVDIRT